MKIAIIFLIVLELIIFIFVANNTLTINYTILKEYDKIAVPRTFQRKNHDTVRDICEIPEILKRLERLEKLQTLGDKDEKISN